MKKVAVILFLSLVSLGSANAMNNGHGGRGYYHGGDYHGGFHQDYGGGCHSGYYGNVGYRGGYWRGGIQPVCVYQFGYPAIGFTITTATKYNGLMGITDK